MLRLGSCDRAGRVIEYREMQGEGVSSVCPGGGHGDDHCAAPKQLLAELQVARARLLQLEELRETFHAELSAAWGVAERHHDLELSRLADIRRLTDQYQSQFDALKSAHDAATAATELELRTLRTRVEDLRSEQRDAIAERDAVVDQLRGWQRPDGGAGSLSHELDRVRAECQALRDEVTRYGAAAASAAEENAATQANREWLEAQLESTRLELAARCGEIRRLRASRSLRLVRRFWHLRRSRRARLVVLLTVLVAITALGAIGRQVGAGVALAAGVAAAGVLLVGITLLLRRWMRRLPGE